MAGQESTHIRIPVDLKIRLNALCSHRETIADVIERLLIDGNKTLTEVNSPADIPTHKGEGVQEFTRLLKDTRDQVERLTQEVQSLKNNKTGDETPTVNTMLTRVNRRKTGVTEEEKMALGHAIKAFCESNGLTRSGFKTMFPDAPDISKSATWERGEGSISPENYKMIAKIVGLTPENSE